MGFISPVMRRALASGAISTLVAGGAAALLGDDPARPSLPLPTRLDQAVRHQEMLCAWMVSSVVAESGLPYDRRGLVTERAAADVVVIRFDDAGEARCRFERPAWMPWATPELAALSVNGQPVPAALRDAVRRDAVAALKSP